MPKETLETIISELAHEEDWRRMRATATCLKGGPKAVDGIIHATAKGSPSFKVEAIKMLARIRDPRAGTSLVEMINDQHEEVSKAALGALEQMAGILDEPTASALVERLKDEQHRKLLLLCWVPFQPPLVP